MILGCPAQAWEGSEWLFLVQLSGVEEVTVPWGLSEGPAQLLFTQLPHLHLCAKCQWLDWDSGSLCLLGLEFFIPWRKDNLGNHCQALPRPGPGSVRGCRELVNQF